MAKSAPQMQKALTQAWVWLKKQREHYPSTDSIWSLRFNFTFLGYHFDGAAAMLEVAPQTISKSLARVTSLLEQQVLTKERLEKYVQGFVNWAKGGLHGLIDVDKARDALMSALEQTEIPQRLAGQKKQNIKHKKRGKLWFAEYWCYRC